MRRPTMSHPAYLLVTIGLVVTGVGLLWLMSGSFPWLGHLPGDIRIEGERSRFYFPLTTCLLLSLLLSSVLWIVRTLLGPR